MGPKTSILERMASQQQINASVSGHAYLHVITSYRATNSSSIVLVNCAVTIS